MIFKEMNNDEFDKSINDFLNQLKIENEIKNRQLERFNKNGNFYDFIEKVIEKYESDKYRDRWYNRGIEPPEDLYWFLFYYAIKYGRECNDEEWKQYGNMFSTDLYFCNGYYFNKMNGQGGAIMITKK